MRSLKLAFGLLSLFLPHYAQGMLNTSFSIGEIDSGIALQVLASQAKLNLKSKSPSASTCRKEDVQMRREWRDLTRNEKIEFANAIECLQALPTNISADARNVFPAVESRYDEYVAVHIKMSSSIHLTASFLAWHRYFIHAFEQDLRNRCNYTSYLPYWEWGHDALAPQNSPLFSGTADSMGSNGALIEDRKPLYWVSNKVEIPVGTGGGCVVSGPFVNYTVKMGPINAPGLAPVPNKLEYNPRCLTRDLNPAVMKTSVTFRNSTDLILAYDAIDLFQGVMQRDPRYPAPGLTYSVHGGGHVGVGLVLGDVETSPSDPIFWVHHAQIDRLWTIWQGLDPERRLNAISGTHSRMNKPPSANMTLDEMLDFGFVAQPVRFADLMNTRAGPFCYEYV